MFLYKKIKNLLFSKKILLIKIIVNLLYTNINNKNLFNSTHYSIIN